MDSSHPDQSPPTPRSLETNQPPEPQQDFVTTLEAELAELRTRLAEQQARTEQVEAKLALPARHG